MKLTVEYHSGNRNMCRIPQLKLRKMADCEGGGSWMPRDQAEAIVTAANRRPSRRQFFSLDAFADPATQLRFEITEQRVLLAIHLLRGKAYGTRIRAYLMEHAITSYSMTRIYDALDFLGGAGFVHSKKNNAKFVNGPGGKVLYMTTPAGRAALAKLLRQGPPALLEAMRIEVLPPEDGLTDREDSCTVAGVIPDREDSVQAV